MDNIFRRPFLNGKSFGEEENEGGRNNGQGVPFSKKE